MRILHTSDWHIGRTFHGHSTLDALRGVLMSLVAEVSAREVDVVIVAGDVFDSAMPAADCYTLLTDTLVAIRDAGARVILTSGNHDSAARLGFQSRLLSDGITVVTDPASIGTPVTIDDESGPVHFYGIPYLEPALVRHLWDGVPVRTQRDALTHAMSLVRDDARARGGRTVAIAHCFAAGVDPTPHLECDIQQGGLDVVPLAVFDDVDYAALGHIHGRQRLSEHVRYAGAPLHYSFGEGSKPRGGWIIDMDATGVASIESFDLPIPRRLVTLTGTLDELLDPARFEDATDAWVFARYTDVAPQSDPMRRLQTRFAHCAKVVHAPDVIHDDGETSYASRLRATRSDLEVIDAFLTHVRNGVGASDAEREILREVVREREASDALV
ncbi:exonuclease SbcCD subunit D [Microbacterium sp. C7(2022)]|uniref:exonuclease SbcCD subunit D n=1 Tax=Microbacterium sp. C7(2022) TaxID=2992759 RepID=UPI00237AA49F|nr:exonuclease SbcCD subunit D [Microbacterium sp. C7(2022)]MDE0546197.1 exonuclease SbcCD subunit D [Microbacterium sp. C7(2022)]